MSIVVTGGAGYIGSTISNILTKAGRSVIVYDNLSNGHQASLPSAVEFIKGDIADREKLENIFKARKVEAVIHLAAFIDASESIKTPERYFRNNISNSLNLVESMLSKGVKQLVFSSTAAVYGNASQIPIKEETLLCPTNAYGESKASVEKMLKWFNQSYGLRCAILRYFNAAGAESENRGEDHNPESHLIPRAFKVALGEIPNLQIFGTNHDTPDGSCVRDFIHVVDLANAHVLALDALKERNCLTYNLGNGRGYSVREVITTVNQITGKSIPIVEVEKRLGDPPILVACSDRIQLELNWKLKFPNLESIISSAWKWHSKHPRGYIN